MSKYFACALLVFSLLTSPTAFAADSGAATQPQNFDRWSVGAGIGWGNPWSYNYLLTELLGRGYSTSRSWALPSPSAYAEIRLHQKLSLLLNFKGNFRTIGRNHDEAEGSSKELSASLGLRYLFNPQKPVEVSAYVLIGGNWMWEDLASNDEYYHGENTFTVDSYFYGLHGAVGIVLERKLGDNLYLRFDTIIAKLQYAYGTASRWYEPADGNNSVEAPDKKTDHTKDINGGFAFSPRISLRVTF